MRTHGWAGAPPSDDDDALTRILDAAREVALSQGRAPRVAEVARATGVTRATVYRYVRNGEELLEALAARETEPFLADLRRTLSGRVDPAEAVVGAVLFVVDTIPTFPVLALALSGSGGAARAAGITSPAAVSFGRDLLQALDVPWAEIGITPEALELLVEHMLRLVQSFLVDPGDPPRHGATLEGYLRTWLVPPVLALCETSTSVEGVDVRP